jgi:hypothetical protein
VPQARKAHRELRALKVRPEFKVALEFKAARESKVSVGLRELQDLKVLPAHKVH